MAADEVNQGIEAMARSFVRLTHSPHTDIAKIRFRDGRELQVRLGSGDEDSALREVAYDFDSKMIHIETLRGDQIEIDAEDSEVGLRGRPVVYLDQCHWSTLANSIFEPALVKRREDLEAAQSLIALARAGKVILPMSSAHALETMALHSSKRQNLACTVLDLSRGWQMRSPIRVRRHEIAEVLSSGFGTSSEATDAAVFSLSPGTMDTRERTVRSRDLPPGLEVLHVRLTAFSAMYDVLMNPDRVEAPKLNGWYEQYNKVSQDPEFRNRTIKQKMIDGRAMAIADILLEAHAVAHSIGIVDSPRIGVELFERMDDMPFLSLYGDVIGFRLANRQKWEWNDLVDMLFMGCAAAYANMVIAERKATNYLSRAWGLREGPCPVVSNIPEAVDRLTSLRA
ncbi:hypothetical protein [Streptomyces malaysiensis]|uniref:hypothetical protein n=1 Tax=Streptomyces malaysiensis TaxID=92644 RepID=UPI0032202C5A|nr:hypothetical protein [Streptomyces malaysiensis]